MALEHGDLAILKRIAFNLRMARLDRGLTQETVAHLAGFSGTNIMSRLEQAQTDSGITKYVRAARAIGVPMVELMAGVDELE